MLKKPWLHLILISSLGFLVYSNTFHVPFQFDDDIFIVRNTALRDFTNFIDPSKITAVELSNDIRRFYNTRLISMLSFWVNFKLGGFDVTGFHAVNTAVHVTSALLVYLVVTLIFRTPLMSGSRLKDLSWAVALFSGLLFVSHPVQTMAVTYIVERWASLAAMFYLLSVFLYIRWRLIQSPSLKAWGVNYLPALLFAIIAMKTKEHAFTLPVMIALMEFMFFRGGIRKRFLHLLPFFATMVIIPYAYIMMNIERGRLSAALQGATSLWGAPGRMDYFLSQFGVITKYIRLLFMPVGQSVFYDGLLRHEFSDPAISVPFIFLSFIFLLGIYLLRRSVKGEPALRLISFGIFWFFIAISVESSVIPIMDVMFEYRVYLPSAGAFVAVVTGVCLIPRERWAKKVLVLGAVAVVIIFSGAAYARNTVWKSEISLWKDTVKKTPLNLQGHYNLARAYASTGQLRNARKAFRNYVKLHPDQDKAKDEFASIFYPRAEITQMFYLETLIELIPDNVEAHRALGDCYARMAMVESAINEYRTVLELRPDYTDMHYKLGKAYLYTRQYDKAKEELLAVMEAEPGNRDAREMLNRISVTNLP